MAQASAEELEHTGPEPLFPKARKNRAVCPKHQIIGGGGGGGGGGERVKVGKSHTLARERGSERGHGEKRVDFTVNKGRKGGQAKRASLEEKEGTMSG